MISRRGFLQSLFAGAAVTAGGILVPQAVKPIIFDLAANTYRQTTPWKMVATKDFEYGSVIGVMFERTHNGERIRHAFHFDICDYIQDSDSCIKLCHDTLNELDGKKTTLFL